MCITTTKLQMKVGLCIEAIFDSFIVVLHFLEVTSLVKEFLQTINRDFPEEFAKCVSSFGQDVTEKVQKLFVS